MKIEINQIAVTRDGLMLGLVLEYTKNGPIRFASVRLEDDVLDWEALNDLAQWLHRQTGRHLDRERELEDEMTLPGV